MRNLGNWTHQFWKPGPLCTGLCAGQYYISVFLALDQINKRNLFVTAGVGPVPSGVTVTGHFPRSFPWVSLCSSQEFWILALHWKHEEKHKLPFMPRLCITPLLHKQFKPEYSGLVIKRSHTSFPCIMLFLVAYCWSGTFLLRSIWAVGTRQCNHAGSHTSDLIWTGLNLAKILP